MAKKNRAVYAPGELSRVREKLGTLDEQEAKQLVQKLGGEIGYERTDDEEKTRQSLQHRIRHERVEVKIEGRPGRPKRAVELAPEAEVNRAEQEAAKSRRTRDLDPEDDPLIPIKSSYWDRVKIDRYAGQPEFEIKSPAQVFQSMLSVFTAGTDYVSPLFVSRRMTEYYKKIETVVVSTRSMFPRNNARRNERMKKTFPLVYLILDAIRYWNIEKISSDLSRIQSHPRSAKVSDFADIIRCIYRPLFILAQMDPDNHIRAAYRILYKVLYIENPMDAQSKYQELIRTALIAFFEVRRDVHYLLYPLLMKLVSAKYVHYERFFTERRNRIMAFLNVSESDQISPVAINVQAEPAAGDETPPEEKSDEEAKARVMPALPRDEEDGEEEKPLTEEEKAQIDAEDAEKKALSRGLQTLEVLFPQAGWDKIETYPDLYPYFVDTFDLKRGIVNIAPTDPMQQIFILMRMLEELFFGLRYVSFGAVPGPSGNLERVNAFLGDLINDWRYYIEMSFEKEYLSRMSEYVRILEGSIEERNSPYTKKLVAGLHWIKRLYFLPYYKFETLIPPPIQKKEVIPIYTKIKILRKYLTAVGLGIEQGNKAGGAEAHAPCDGIDNPWEPYVFQVPNPLSIRLDALLAPKARNNAALIYFCLAVATVLDYLVNNEKSWAYGTRPDALFRSINNEGVRPLIGIDTKIDAEAIFKQSIKQRQKKQGET